MNAAASAPPQRSNWPALFALCALVCAIPLFAFGGSITTLGAGMAVQGWLDAEGHFMLAFPVDMWLRDLGTFVEHTHRLWATLVGLFALLAAGCGWRGRGTVRNWTLFAVLAVIAQGVLGGLRVDRVSPELAFVHGGFAQGVFAALALAALVLSKRWTAAPAGVLSEGGARLGRLGLAVTLFVWAQIWVGAWYRHSLRNFGLEGTEALSGRLHLHLGLGLLVMVAVLLFARALGRASRALESGAFQAGAGDAQAARRLRLQSRWLGWLVVVQVLLGLAAWLLQRPDQLLPVELTLTVVHLLTGAVLLAQCAASWIWVHRFSERPANHPGAIPAT